MAVRTTEEARQSRAGVDSGSRKVWPGRRVLANALSQDLDQVDFGLRRFRLRNGPAREILEHSGRSFLEGFNAALSRPAGDRLASAIDEIDLSFRGFAYEGAGMACALLDILNWSGGRNVRGLLAGPALNYPHLVHVGAGWAFARMRLRPEWGRSILRDPLLRWLAWDGYGFHQGFFHADRVVGGRSIERALTPDQRAIRDQGLGRSLWFHECADPEGISLRVGEFAASRRGDLWSGVGLAATYAGGSSPAELQSLSVLAGEYRADLAQGCAFACEARRISGVVPPHTRQAAEILTAASVEVAGSWANESQAALTAPTGTSENYQQWRAGIRRLWVDHMEGQPR